jgi:hypothetical protein
MTPTMAKTVLKQQQQQQQQIATTTITKKGEKRAVKHFISKLELYKSLLRLPLIIFCGKDIYICFFLLLRYRACLFNPGCILKYHTLM